eukprot:scaffold59842_cov59-Cyclotella_meneghiniana.AAC.2
MQTAFASEMSPHFPSDLDKVAVQNFRYESRSDEAMKVFADSRKFQQEAVMKWNPHLDEIKQSMMIVMNPMEEAASMETGAKILELLIKAGVMSIDDDGKFAVGDLSKFIILAGDVKTVDNLNLIQETIRSSMKGRGFTELSHQLSVFDQALSRVMDLPGDWHASLSMLQAIISLFYDALLYPILHGMLGWNRFKRETNKCYYTSAQKEAIDTTNLSEEDTANVTEEEEIEQYEIPDAAQEDENMLGRGTVELEEEEMSPDDAESNRKRGFNVNCLIDVWSKGKDLLRKDGIKECRERAKERDIREKKMMDVIGQIIADAQSVRRNTRLKREPEEVEEPD